MGNAKDVIKKISLLAMTMTLCLGLLVGCGGPANLEEAFSDKDVQEQLSALETAGVTITAEDNTLVYTYKYTDAYDFSDATVREQVKAGLEEASTSLETTFQTLASSIEKETGLSGISVKVSYVDSSDEVLYERTFAFK